MIKLNEVQSFGGVFLVSRKQTKENKHNYNVGHRDKENPETAFLRQDVRHYKFTITRVARKARLQD